MAQVSQLGTIYAKAFFETVMDRKGSLADVDKYRDELVALLNGIDSSKEARTALFGLATSANDKSQLIQEMAKKFKFSDVVSQFLQLMARKGRLILLREMEDALAGVRLEAENGVLGELVSADPLDEADVKNLAKSFESKLGKKVEFNVSTDPDLLAGLKVTVGGITYDGTLRSQLERLQSHLIEGTATLH